MLKFARVPKMVYYDCWFIMMVDKDVFKHGCMIEIFNTSMI